MKCGNWYPNATSLGVIMPKAVLILENLLLLAMQAIPIKFEYSFLPPPKTKKDSVAMRLQLIKFFSFYSLDSQWLKDLHLAYVVQEQARKEKEELERMLEENRRRVEEAQRREALEQQRREEQRYRELEQIQRQKEEVMRRKKQEEEEERAKQIKLLGKNKSRPKVSFAINSK